MFRFLRKKEKTKYTQLDYNRTTWPPSKWDEHPEWQFELIRASSCISVKKKFIFIHIGKTGGHPQVRGVFEKKLKDAVNSPNLDKPINHNKWDAYFKYTFVRNPWDKVVSAYYSPNTWFDRRSNHPLLNKLPDNYGPHNISFSNFVKEILWDENGDPCQPHWVEQYKFIENFRRQNEKWVNFIGKFENLNKDWGKVCQQIGIDEKLPYTNKNLIKQKRNYQEYYDDETIEIVRSKYKRDIELFSYTFDKN
jgi:hypothetical protein